MYSQIKQHMNIPLLSVFTGLAAENPNLLRFPILVARQNSHRGALEAFRLGLHPVPCADVLLHSDTDVSFYSFSDWSHGETDKMTILWPGAIGNNEFLHPDVLEASVPEPFFKLGPRVGLVASLLECINDKLLILLEPCAFGATII